LARFTIRATSGSARLPEFFCPRVPNSIFSFPSHPMFVDLRRYNLSLCHRLPMSRHSHTAREKRISLQEKNCVSSHSARRLLSLNMEPQRILNWRPALREWKGLQEQIRSCGIRRREHSVRLPRCAAADTMRMSDTMIVSRRLPLPSHSFS